MWALAISIIFGAIYWTLEESIIKYRFGMHHTKVLALFKWITVLGLILEHLHIHYDVLYQQLTKIIGKCIVLSMYGIGDIVIVFNQNYSILFFALGHILLITESIVKILVLAIEYIVGIIVISLVATTIFGYIFKQTNNNLTNYEHGLYIIYIFILSLVITTPIVASGYFGTLLFVISDILIGFKIKQLSKLSFPLYYASLLCLLYVYIH